MRREGRGKGGGKERGGTKGGKEREGRKTNFYFPSWKFSVSLAEF